MKPFVFDWGWYKLDLEAYKSYLRKEWPNGLEYIRELDGKRSWRITDRFHGGAVAIESGSRRIGFVPREFLTEEG